MPAMCARSRRNRPAAQHPHPARYRLPRQQCTDRARRPDRDSAHATDKVQYEGELAVIIGRHCKHLTRDNALSAVLGYTIGNDVSERSWQRSDRTLWRAKNTDTFKPMGPWIETDVRLEESGTKIRLNGKQLIEFRTNDMVFGVIDYLVAITRYLTLFPGDMMWIWNRLTGGRQA